MNTSEALAVVHEIRRAGGVFEVFDVARDGMPADPEGEYSAAERKAIQHAARHEVVAFSESDLEEWDDRGRRAVLAARREWRTQVDNPAKPKFVVIDVVEARVVEEFPTKAAAHAAVKRLRGKDGQFVVMQGAQGVSTVHKRTAAKNPGARAPKLSWVPWSLALGKKLSKVSGAYAIRRKDSHAVVYVGESHHGRLYKTMARHFYLPASKGASFATDRPSDYEVAWQVTSKGSRPRSGSRAPDQRALNKQAKWIAALNPFHNKDDGMGASERSGADYRTHRAKQAADERDADPWDGLTNPSSPLTELGKLTAIETVKHEWVWNLKDAPILAYDKKGRLFIVYAGKVVRPSDAPERREYLRTHWGRSGDGHVRTGQIALGPFTKGEPSTRICYTTQKGLDRKLVDYVHEWGEGGRGPTRRPTLVEHACTKACGARCAGKGAMALKGGSYTMKMGGITG